MSHTNVPNTAFTAEQLAAWSAELREAVRDLIRQAKAAEDDLFVIGCSTSEIHRAPIGTQPAPVIGKMLVETLLDELQYSGIALAAQCCEHLNRSLVVEAKLAKQRGYRRVNAIPQPAAGGSFATAAWEAFEEPWLVESVEAELALDIGDTLIGMHLRPVVVPVRLAVARIGDAHLTAARSRTPFTGGDRAIYDERLK